MATTVSVERGIPAPAAELWHRVSDVTRMPQWSPENVGAAWLDGASAAAVGARFKGDNRNGDKTWDTNCTVVDAEPAHLFGFRVKAGPFAVAEWRYTFEPTPNGTRVTETWIDRRNPLLRVLSARVTGVPDRSEHNRRSMEQTLANLEASLTAG